MFIDRNPAFAKAYFFPQHLVAGLSNEVFDWPNFYMFMTSTHNLPSAKGQALRVHDGLIISEYSFSKSQSNKRLMKDAGDIVELFN